MIDELVPSVWIKSDRSGLSLAVRIVLPRTIDPAHGPAADDRSLGQRLQRRSAVGNNCGWKEFRGS